MVAIKRSMVFEGVLVTLLLLLSFMIVEMTLGGSLTGGYTSIGSINFMYMGSDDTLYTIADTYNNSSYTSIKAIAHDGTPLWSYDTPDQLRLSNCQNSPICWNNVLKGIDDSPLYAPALSSDNGTIYIYLQPDDEPRGLFSDDGRSLPVNEEVIAISRSGNVLWNVSFDSRKNVAGSIAHYKYGNGTSAIVYIHGIPIWLEDVSIYAHNGCVYVFHEYNETVLDASDGKVLWNVENVSDPASVDENGFVYLALARNATEEPITQHLLDFRVPGDMICAYYPNGTLYWHVNVGESITRLPVQDGSGLESLPLYHDGTVYAPLGNGLRAYDLQGNEKWAVQLDRNGRLSGLPGSPENNTYGILGIFTSMPFDSSGNVYLQGVVNGTDRKYLFAIAPNGSLLSDMVYGGGEFNAISNGIGYTIGAYNNSLPISPSDSYTGPHRLEDLATNILTAYDLKTGKKLWNYTIPIYGYQTVVLNESNVYNALPLRASDAIYNNQNPYFIDYYEHNPQKLFLIYDTNARIFTTDDRIYVSFITDNVEYPVLFNQSKCAFARGIYAFDRSGRLLWYMPSASPISWMAIGKDTIFYSTGGGRLYVTGKGAATGFTLAALAYLFLRFFCVGAVARARARVNNNEMRNKVYAFITANPASTAYEVSRGMSASIGTVRYHMLILGMDHKIVPRKMDGKYVRYFTNSNSYSHEQQLVLSMLRRETMGKILSMLSKCPGASNLEIATGLGMPESVTSRCLKELAEKGIVRNESHGRERAYSVNDAYTAFITEALKHLGAL
jgi:predicted transcriptional regulator